MDYDCAGYFGFQCGQPIPEWRHRFRATWETNFNMSFSLGWRYVGEVEIDDLDPQLLAGRHDLLGAVDVVRRHLRDVHETLDAFTDLDEGTELDQLGDPAVHELADLVMAGGREIERRRYEGRLERVTAQLAELEHLAEHGPAPPAGNLGGTLESQSGGRRIRVVAVVEDDPRSETVDLAAQTRWPGRGGHRRDGIGGTEGAARGG